MMTVSQMINDNGNGAMNQFILEDSENSIIAFQSYASRIATVDYKNRTITIGKDYDYSTTTGKHRNIFFREYTIFKELADLKTLRKAIEDGFYGNYQVIVA